MKDIHKGKRCFILGSGPSIKKENLKVLKNEVVFALNNFYVHEDFKEIMEEGVAKYHMLAPIHRPQKESEWRAWFDDMEKNMPKNVVMLCGLNGYKENTKYLFSKYRLFEGHDAYWYFASRSFDGNEFKRKGVDLERNVYSGESVSIYALICALYMGFDEIYLLGMDHDYFLYDKESEMRMYSSAAHQNNEFERTFGDRFYDEEFNRQYKIFIKYRELQMIAGDRIFNASSGGVLRTFPRVKFKDLF